MFTLIVGENISCPEKYIEVGGICFLFNTVIGDFDHNNNFCLSNGGRLLTVKTANVTAALVSLLGK